MPRNNSTVEAIKNVRNCVCAVMRVRSLPLKKKKGRGERQFNLGFVGSGYCIVENRLVLTAHHILNNRNKRREDDKFYVFVVPDNGLSAYPASVTGFPIEDTVRDLAVLELGTPPDDKFSLKAGPISIETVPDGEEVVTYGFPAPEVSGGNVDMEGSWLGGGVMS